MEVVVPHGGIKLMAVKNERCFFRDTERSGIIAEDQLALEHTRNIS